jgi:hypothetical protein
METLATISPNIFTEGREGNEAPWVDSRQISKQVLPFPFVMKGKDASRSSVKKQYPAPATAFFKLL